LTDNARSRFRRVAPARNPSNAYAKSLLVALARNRATTRRSLRARRAHRNQDRNALNASRRDQRLTTLDASARFCCFSITLTRHDTKHVVAGPRTSRPAACVIILCRRARSSSHVFFHARHARSIARMTFRAKINDTSLRRDALKFAQFAHRANAPR
jgi:hypothetical protein